MVSVNKVNFSATFSALGYWLGQVIQAGTFSTVRVCEKRTGAAAMYAVKIMDTANADNVYVNKFLPRELDCCRRLEHPNIIHVLEIFQV